MDPDEGGVATTVEMSDIIALHLSTVTSLSISPTFSVGTLPTDGSKTLVPLASCVMHGEFGDKEGSEAVRVLLSMDNLAFLVMRLGEECREAVEAFEEVSKGDLTPLVERIEATAQWFEAGAGSLQEAAELLQGLSQRLEAIDAGGPEEVSREPNVDEIKKKRSSPKREARNKT